MFHMQIPNENNALKVSEIDFRQNIVGIIGLISFSNIPFLNVRFAYNQNSHIHSDNYVLLMI